MSQILAMNYDTLQEIAQYVPAHPQAFLRLATVNRLFHQVFRSDRVWKRIDFHGVEHLIAQHFINWAAGLDDKNKKCLGTITNALIPCWHCRWRCNSSGMCKCDRWIPAQCGLCDMYERHQDHNAHLFFLDDKYHLEDKYTAFLVLANQYPNLCRLEDYPRDPALRKILVFEHGMLAYGTAAERSDPAVVRAAVASDPDAAKYAMLN